LDADEGGGSYGDVPQFTRNPGVLKHRSP